MFYYFVKLFPHLGIALAAEEAGRSRLMFMWYTLTSVEKKILVNQREWCLWVEVQPNVQNGKVWGFCFCFVFFLGWGQLYQETKQYLEILRNRCTHCTSVLNIDATHWPEQQMCPHIRACPPHVSLLVFLSGIWLENPAPSLHSCQTRLDTLTWCCKHSFYLVLYPSFDLFKFCCQLNACY